MHRGRVGALVVAALVAAGCGGGGGASKGDATRLGRTVHGETETGMKLTVQTFLAPSADPELAKLDKYRAAAGYQPVDFHRVTADNTHGSVADRGRQIDFAASADAIASGQAIESRFVCDVLQYEWLPKEDSVDEVATYRSLRSELCKNGPPKDNGIAPGQRQSYFLVTDRGFAARGIKQMRIFGPLSAELR
jgi:hypothetical protein